VYLKALEIQGFKSFPDKTVLNFGEDITAIVGPNGSGKSNISDAIRWVMGEQSSRSLRGAKMEDVIFGGTEKRAPVGFAQVTLVLDNTEHIFPMVDSPEVMVTRRYYRSGESEYYINKQSVRLRDINELFMDTGLGKEGYSNIGQGQIAEILSLRSTDRRAIFEEAAGISKYRHRKEESERKLQKTDENLVRINDKIAELELQVGPLRDQSEKAKRYLILRDELRLLEISVWLTNLETIKASTAKLEADLAIAAAQKEAAEQALDELFVRNEQYGERVRACDLSAESIREEMGELEGRIGEEDNAMAVLRTNLQHNQESVERLEAELAEQDSQAGSLTRRIQEQNERIAAIDAEASELEQQVSELLAKVQEAAQKAGTAADEAEALRAREALETAAAADCRAEAAALTAAIGQMEERRTHLAEELENWETQWNEKNAEAKKCRRALEDAEDDAAAAANVIQGHALKMEGRQRRDQAAQDRHVQLTMEMNALTSRIHLLTEMEKEYEGYNKAVRLVMQAAEKSALRGVHGPIANLLQTPEQYNVAIEIALGAGLQNIVVDREEDAKGAIQYLKQRDGGRATFLPLTAIRGDVLREKGLEQEYGYVGVASELIRYDEKYDNIFKNLLGRTVVAEDLDCGISMARRYQNRFRVVTLDGQVINRGGSMTGGSVSRSAGILSRRGELERLGGQESGLRQQLADAAREKEEARRDLTAAQYEMEVAESQRRAAEDAVLKLRTDKEHYDILLEGLRLNREALEGEQEALTSRLEDSRGQVAASEKTAAAHEAAAAGLRQQAADSLSGQNDLQSLTGQLNEDITAGKEALAARRAERETTCRALADLERLRESMLEDKASRRQLIEEYLTAREAAETELGRRTEAVAGLRMEVQTSKKRLAELTEEKLRIEQERTAVGRELQDRNATLNRLQLEVSRLDTKRATGAMEEKQILDRLWEQYELSHSAAVEQRIELESLSKANRRIGELKRESASLGNVNLGAIEEFERVNGRYTYLTEQRDDVQRAKGELEGVIEEITKEMTAIFAQQFPLINEAFQEVFVQLFGGGKATLELEDPDDILHCGIEIKVQPPGKALKTITLLSGGEKAFVAIALYFAILKVHPTPFCVMDEIEAALDEANVVRFARYMRNITGKTQFIVITHRRGTMEEADVLYGITMQEKGVSKMLTINMNDVAKELKIK